MLIARFKTDYEVELTLQEEQDVEIMFEEHLTCLTHTYKEMSYKEAETAAAYRQRVPGKHKSVLDRQRPNSRRGQVSDMIKSSSIHSQMIPSYLQPDSTLRLVTDKLQM